MSLFRALATGSVVAVVLCFAAYWAYFWWQEQVDFRRIDEHNAHLARVNEPPRRPKD